MIGGFASALIPVHWTEQSEPDGGAFEWTEDGFDGFDRNWAFYAAGLEPATIQFWLEDCPRDKTAAAYLRECARNSLGRVPKRFEPGVVRATAGTATAAFSRDGSSCLAAAAIRGGRAAAVHGEAPPSRFSRFRGLFAFVAASLRVGPAALAEEGCSRIGCGTRLIPIGAGALPTRVNAAVGRSRAVPLLARDDERAGIVTLCESFELPLVQIVKRSSVPPQRGHTGVATFRSSAPNPPPAESSF